MDVRAVILVGGRSMPLLHEGDQQRLAIEGQPRSSALPERVCGVPIGLHEVLGEPIVQRVLTRLKQFGVTSASVVSELPPSSIPTLKDSSSPHTKWLYGTGAQFWRCAETAFSDLAQAGAELIILVRLGAYTEIDYEELIQFHLEKQSRVTCAVDLDGQCLDTFAISASRRNDAAYLLRHELKQARSSAAEYTYSGYINRLETAADLRLLTLDSFAKVVSFSPAGTEIKPGVWAGEGVRIHRTARVLAPAFLGAHSRVRALSVVTRGSVIEHHAEIDCGSVIESSNILPNSYVGPGLDVAHSIVGFRRIAHLKKNVEVEIFEPKFLGMRTAPAVRAISSAFSLAAFLPRQIFRGFSRAKRTEPATLPQAISAPAAALKARLDKNANPQEREFSADLAVARRYGNE
jgi:NDP-sugar pyrophosphorylase family protein